MERWYSKAAVGYAHFPISGAIHLVELRPGEIPIDRKRLKEVFRAYIGDEALFASFCKSLGLKEYP